MTRSHFLIVVRNLSHLVGTDGEPYAAAGSNPAPPPPHSAKPRTPRTHRATWA